MPGRLSLRTRLVLGVIVLAAVGLAAADVATYASLRSFLIERTDRSLAEFARGDGGGRHGPGPEDDARCPGNDGRPFPGGRPGDYVERRSSDGMVLCSGQLTSRSGETSPAPELPETLPAPRAPDGETFFTAGAEDGDGRFRAIVAATPSGGTLLVATPLDDVDATLERLLLIMLFVTVAVLGALAALGLWVVRLGLRPLLDIETTAATIAAGDLSHRVERADERTEVGRLGLALNAMLEQIESAFRAREASESKLRRFVADASHELRTPLAAIRAYAELFDRGAAERPEDLARSMAGIGRESERMSLLVEDLLLLARLDEGRPLERERVALDDVVAEAVETARTLEPERPIELSVEPVAVVGDRDRLRQVVDNLLGNVRAHTPAGTAARVGVRRNGTDAVVEVADDGPGLTEADRSRVFERFYRADQSRSRASGGVGLGLSIVAAVAAAHGGRAAVTSADAGGTTFTIVLPAAP